MGIGCQNNDNCCSASNENQEIKILVDPESGRHYTPTFATYASIIKEEKQNGDIKRDFDTDLKYYGIYKLKDKKGSLY